MTEWLYRVSLGGIPIEIESRYALSSFEDFSTKEAPAASVSLNPKPYREISGCRYAEADIKNIELYALAAAASNKLLPFNRVFFHGAAFLWQGKAWILTAPSGTGKTTQYALWKKLYGEEIRLINGDKPILSVDDAGKTEVYSSPWCGKEHMYQQLKAPLGGMIYLKRAKENRIFRLQKSEAAIPLYHQFIFSPDETAAVSKVCELEEKLLTSCRIWLLENRGDEASAEMTHDYLLTALADDHS